MNEKGSEVLENKFAQLLINRLLSDASKRGADEFAQKMLKTMESQLDKWLTINRPAFVLNALLEHSQCKAQTKALLQPRKKILEANKKLPAIKVIMKNLAK